jgi:branched-chain amino acid aminotransferase
LNYINLNGKITHVSDVKMPIDNGAFRYGYGLIETMLVQDSTIRLKQYHWDRLFAGLAQLELETGALVTPAYLENEILRTVKTNKSESLCRVRLQMFAGGGGLYGAENRKADFIIECFSLEPDTRRLNENGFVTGVAVGLSKSQDALSNLKSCNALIYAMAAQQARQHKWNDALVCNTPGSIIESSIANIFWIKNGNIYTPPLSDGCVAGVMRRYLIEKTGAVAERSLTLPDLLQADEVFLTNAIKGIRWVSRIDEAAYGNEQVRNIYQSVF